MSCKILEREILQLFCLGKGPILYYEGSGCDYHKETNFNFSKNFSDALENT